MSVIVVEVMGRASQGQTRPYLCRGDDDEVYFVKGRGAGRRSLVCEWICANLATNFDLPIAPFCLVEVPEELMDAPDSSWLSDLGIGTAFASRRLVAAEFASAFINAVPLELRQDVLIFDWWIRNADRSLTVRGGNPNLLWQPDGATSRLRVIDYNLAFDDDFDDSDFALLHAFREVLDDTFSDFVLRAAYVERFAAALTSWDTICESIPEAWLFIDDERTIPVNFSTAHMHDVLNRAFRPEFWQVAR